MVGENKDYKNPAIYFGVGIIAIMYGLIVLYSGSKDMPALLTRRWRWINWLKEVISNEVLFVFFLLVGVLFIGVGIWLIKKKRSNES